MVEPTSTVVTHKWLLCLSLLLWVKLLENYHSLTLPNQWLIAIWRLLLSITKRTQTHIWPTSVNKGTTISYTNHLASRIKKKRHGSALLFKNTCKLLNETAKWVNQLTRQSCLRKRKGEIQDGLLKCLEDLVTHLKSLSSHLSKNVRQQFRKLLFRISKSVRRRNKCQLIK